MIAVLAAIGSPALFGYVWWRIVTYRGQQGTAGVLSHIYGCSCAVPIAFFFIGAMALADEKSYGGMVFFATLFAVCLGALIRRTPIDRTNKLQQRPVALRDRIQEHAQAVRDAIEANRTSKENRQRTPRAAVADTAAAAAMSVQFRYKNEMGQRSRRHVDVTTVDDSHFQGYCHHRKTVRTFRFDRIQGDVIDADTGEVMSVYDWQRALFK